MLASPAKTLEDWVKIKLPGTRISFRRDYTGAKAHEISIIIPRLEIRRRFELFGRVVYSREVILNSLTVVDAPRHPPGGGEADRKEASEGRALTTAVSKPPLKINYR